MSRFPIIIIFFLALLTYACLDTPKPLKVKESQKVIEMSKSPCFGNCPEYNITIYETGIATFQGIRNTDRLGLFMKKIGQERVQQIINKCVSANLMQFQDVYKSDVPDLQTVTIVYYEGKEKKTIAGKRERPLKVLEIEELLDEIAFSADWEKVEDAPSDLPPGVIANELVVKLNRNVEALAWSKRYAQEDLKLKKVLSADKTFWLVTFDDRVIDSQEMLQILRQDRDVFSVQYNQYYQ